MSSNLYADINNIRAEAARVDPVKAFLTIVGLPFVVLFFLLRFVWMVPAFIWMSGMWGWSRADAAIKQATAAARGG